MCSHPCFTRFLRFTPQKCELRTHFGDVCVKRRCARRYPHKIAPVTGRIWFITIHQRTTSHILRLQRYLLRDRCCCPWYECNLRWWLCGNVRPPLSWPPCFRLYLPPYWWMSVAGRVFACVAALRIPAPIQTVCGCYLSGGGCCPRLGIHIYCPTQLLHPAQPANMV